MSDKDRIEVLLRKIDELEDLVDDLRARLAEHEGAAK